MLNYKTIEKTKEGYKSSKLLIVGAALGLALSGGCAKVEQPTQYNIGTITNEKTYNIEDSKTEGIFPGTTTTVKGGIEHRLYIDINGKKDRLNFWFDCKKEFNKFNEKYNIGDKIRYTTPERSLSRESHIEKIK